MSSHDAVLVLGSYRQTLTVIRSLARAGWRVILGAPDTKAFCARSRYVHEIWRHPPLTPAPEPFGEALRAFLRSHPEVRFVFPVGERELHALALGAARLPATVGAVMACPEAALRCLDKAGMYRLAQRLGVPVAPFGTVHSRAQLVQRVREFGLPCVVKPNDSLSSFFAHKAVILSAHAQLTRVLLEWPRREGFALVQRFVPGRRVNAHFLAHDGRLLAYFEQAVARTDRRDGTGYCVDGVTVAPNAVRRAHCERLVRELRYEGVGCAQFLSDPVSGAMHFLEINPRLDANCAIPYYAGYDFPALALAHARFLRGELPAPPSETKRYRAGRRGNWLSGDIAGLLAARRARNLSGGQTFLWGLRALFSFLRAHVHLTWSWRDPLPTALLFAHFLLPYLRWGKAGTAWQKAARALAK